jgi:two-component system, NtrC family, response regulator AtoC
MLTQYGTIDSAIEATRLAAVDYVTKPFRVEELRLRLEHVVHTVELKREAINTAPSPEESSDITDRTA